MSLEAFKVVFFLGGGGVGAGRELTHARASWGEGEREGEREFRGRAGSQTVTS